MGSVYVVEQMSTGKPRALKLMLPDLISDPTSRRRFEQEARIASRIQSEHVVQVVGSGIDRASGTPWLAMELLSGHDLAEVLAKRIRLEPAQVLTIFEQLCHALGAAHRVGIVHRDLKPENLFLANSQRAGAEAVVKVLDFGIAKIVAEAKTNRTAQVGSPLWMAPEQTELSGITPATDVWALGLIAFNLLTGRYFWKSANLGESTIQQLLREMLFDPIPRASTRASELRCEKHIPGRFDEWFSRCVSREPSARFADAERALGSLRLALAEKPIGGERQVAQPGQSRSERLPPRPVRRGVARFWPTTSWTKEVARKIVAPRRRPPARTGSLYEDQLAAKSTTVAGRVVRFVGFGRADASSRPLNANVNLLPTEERIGFSAEAAVAKFGGISGRRGTISRRTIIGLTAAILLAFGVTAFVLFHEEDEWATRPQRADTDRGVSAAAMASATSGPAVFSQFSDGSVAMPVGAEEGPPVIPVETLPRKTGNPIMKGRGAREAHTSYE
jgi:serine/threonine protein kinase